MASTDIEKNNLEAHVELCAERYDYLQDKLETLGSRMDTIEKTLVELKDLVTGMRNHRQNQLISWGTGIIAALTGALSLVLYNMLTK
jgi:prefoldin subunit 5